MKKNTIRRIATAILLATTLAIPTTIQAQTGVASSLAVQLAKNTNTAYKPAEIKQPGGTIYFDGKPIDMMGTTILNANSSTLLPIAPIAKALNTQPSWDAENKVAKISYNGHYAECVQGSDKVILDGNSTKKSAVPTINHNSRMYLPLRTLSESLGLNVSYDANTKNVYITTSSQAKPVEPLPTQEIPNPYNVTVPEKYKNTTWLLGYNFLRENGQTNEQALETLSHCNPIVAGNVKGSMTWEQQDDFVDKRKEYNNMAYHNVRPTTRGEYQFQYKDGYFWMYGQWCADAGMYACIGTLNMRN